LTIVNICGIYYIMEKIQFTASLPNIFAIAIGGQDKNSRIKLDVPASDLAAVMELLALDSPVFKVTIEKIENSESDW